MSLKEFLANFLKQISTIKSDGTDIKPRARIASYLQIKQLKEIVADLSQGSTAKNAMESPSSLRNQCAEIFKYLSDTWDEHKEFDTVYQNAPHLKMNRINLILAEQLAEMLNKNSKIKTHAYDLLMPDVLNGGENFEFRDEVINLKLHQFIFAEDGRPIDITKCLDDAYENSTGILHHTFGEKKRLTENEKQRVINHSVAAVNYYCVIEHKSNNNIGPNRAYELEKKAFHTDIQSNAYRVKSSYGEESNKKLLEYIVKKIKSISDLAEVMEECLQKNEWKNFIESIDDKDLLRIVLENDSLINVTQKKKNYSGNTLHDKAVLYCLTEVYKRQRKELGSKYKTVSGHVAGYLANYTFGLIDAYEMTEKLNSAKVFQQFILSEHGLDRASLDLYLQQPDINKYKSPLTQSMSDLYMIVSQADEVSSPAYFNKQETTSNTWSAWRPW